MERLPLNGRAERYGIYRHSRFGLFYLAETFGIVALLFEQLLEMRFTVQLFVEGGEVPQAQHLVAVLAAEARLVEDPPVGRKLLRVSVIVQ